MHTGEVTRTDLCCRGYTEHAFPSQQEALDDYIAKLEEAKKRDHRKIGKEMDLFMLYEEGTGIPVLHA